MQLVAVASFFGLWQVASTAGWVDPEQLPPVSEVARTAAGLLGDRAFLGNLGDTAIRVAVAFGIGAPLAISFGLFVGEHSRVERVVSPLFNFIMAIPQSIFLPIFIFFLGIGFVEKVVYGVTHVLFVVSVSAAAAVHQVPKDYAVAARSFGWSAGAVYRKVYLPAMAPVIVNGLRLGLVFNIIGVLLAEMYASQTGLGVLIFRWGEAYDSARTMAVILLVSCFTVLANESMRLWEMRVGRWRSTQHD